MHLEKYKNGCEGHTPIHVLLALYPNYWTSESLPFLLTIYLANYFCNETVNFFRIKKPILTMFSLPFYLHCLIQYA